MYIYSIQMYIMWSSRIMPWSSRITRGPVRLQCSCLYVSLTHDLRVVLSLLSACAPKLNQRSECNCGVSLHPFLGVLGLFEHLSPGKRHPKPWSCFCLFVIHLLHSSWARRPNAGQRRQKYRQLSVGFTHCTACKTKTPNMPPQNHCHSHVMTGFSCISKHLPIITAMSPFNHCHHRQTPTPSLFRFGKLVCPGSCPIV